MTCIQDLSQFRRIFQVLWLFFDENGLFLEILHWNHVFWQQRCCTDARNLKFWIQLPWVHTNAPAKFQAWSSRNPIKFACYLIKKHHFMGPSAFQAQKHTWSHFEDAFEAFEAILQAKAQSNFYSPLLHEYSEILSLNFNSFWSGKIRTGWDQWKKWAVLTFSLFLRGSEDVFTDSESPFTTLSKPGWWMIFNREKNNFSWSNFFLKSIFLWIFNRNQRF